MPYCYDADWSFCSIALCEVLKSWIPWCMSFNRPCLSWPPCSRFCISRSILLCRSVLVIFGSLHYLSRRACVSLPVCFWSSSLVSSLPRRSLICIPMSQCGNCVCLPPGQQMPNYWIHVAALLIYEVPLLGYPPPRSCWRARLTRCSIPLPLMLFEQLLDLPYAAQAWASAIAVRSEILPHAAGLPTTTYRFEPWSSSL